MSKELENLNDIAALIERKYSISFISGTHIVINDVPYLNENGALCWGKLAAQLHLLTPDTLGKPFNHQMFWSGSYPYFLDGTNIPVNKIACDLTLGGTQFLIHLSNKEKRDGQFIDFENYFDLVEHYVALISAPASEKYSVSPYTGARYNIPQEESAFKISDTFSAKAEITDLNSLISKDRIAIIGLGGTGAYVLDFIAKTPVYSIDAYDFDIFEVHNAFRSPGEFQQDDFGMPKTGISANKYDNLKHRLTVHNKKVSAEDKELFSDTTFAFVCIDDGESRAEICDMLISLKIPFIDTGMGIEKEDGTLDGLIRTTFFDENSSERARKEVPTEKHEEENAYRVFVQISELNAINAAIAVIRYKKHRGFYRNEDKFYQNYISLGSSNWIGEI